MPARCCVYVLKSTADGTRYYVGCTSDVAARVAAHNAGACAHTRKYLPWQLHVRIEFSDEEHATAFERFLKSGSGRAFAKRHFDWPSPAPSAGRAVVALTGAAGVNQNRMRKLRLALGEAEHRERVHPALADTV
jgi:putative endonuclease